MKDEIKERISYLKRDMKLSDKEAEYAARFIRKHRRCKTICQSLGRIRYIVSFHDGPVGTYVTIKCENCNEKDDISDEVRSNW